MSLIAFSDQDMRDYFTRLIGKVYKILPICENSFSTKDVYIHSLIGELLGCLQVSNNAFHRTEFMTVINTLSYLTTVDQYDPVIYRREVFKCIRIIKKIGDLK